MAEDIKYYTIQVVEVSTKAMIPETPTEGIYYRVMEDINSDNMEYWYSNGSLKKWDWNGAPHPDEPI